MEPKPTDLLPAKDETWQNGVCPLIRLYLDVLKLTEIDAIS